MDEELRNALASDYFVSLTNEVRVWRLKFKIEKGRDSATSELVDGDLDNLFDRWIYFERKISGKSHAEETED